MDRFELVEKLVKSTGVSYEDAKTALESSGWDLLDAAVWLEKNGRIEVKTSHFTTDPEQQQQQEQAAEQQRQQQQTRSETVHGYASSQYNTRRDGFLHNIITKIKGILIDNELVICKQSGEIFLELPIWLSVLLLVVAFWPTIGVLVLVFILGFRFRFHGPDLGGELLNGILNKAENSASRFVDKVKKQYASNRENAKNDRNEDVIDYKDPYK